MPGDMKSGPDRDRAPAGLKGGHCLLLQERVGHRELLPPSDNWLYVQINWKFHP